MANKQELADLVKELAVVHGKVTLSSRAEADYYVDLRRATLHNRASKIIGELLRELTADWDYTAVGGLTLGADPVATAVMHAPGRPIDAFVVRKEAKKHGMQRRIEGPDIVGKKSAGGGGYDHHRELPTHGRSGIAGRRCGSGWRGNRSGPCHWRRGGYRSARPRIPVPAGVGGFGPWISLALPNGAPAWAWGPGPKNTRGSRCPPPRVSTPRCWRRATGATLWMRTATGRGKRSSRILMRAGTACISQ